ncbi:hypothetical protein GIY62_10905 [Burkholderia plantarii]|uniref:hypothetical protein n=1 Tax=Burkholderia plantarii TaxID=41899 RepID=UPI00272BFA6E|nr:hypothetical protein [Burkholderia plantarii]WLE57675.1 hypothetical protein GIY62_10905 [Burkholderia plantarii]
MSMKRYLAGLTALLILTGAGTRHAEASDLTISASYRGNLAQTNGHLTNTTPQSGMCVDHPQACPPGSFSLLFPWAGNAGGHLGVKLLSKDPRAPFEDRFYIGFNVPSFTFVTVADDAGFTRSLSFEVTSIGLSANRFPASPTASIGHSGCDFMGGTAWGQSPFYAMFKSASSGYCVYYGPPQPGLDSVEIGDVSFSYRLTLDQPWTWRPGIYRGSYLYRFGPGNNLDFGRNFQGNTDDVMLHFVVSVEPDMYVHFLRDGNWNALTVEMEPMGGWLAWQSEMPPVLTGSTWFDFGTRGPVSISMACAYPVGDGCGIAQNDTSPALGVDVLLTDAGLTDDTGRQAIDSRLTQAPRVFTPVSAQGSGIRQARLTFRTSAGTTGRMRRGESYYGLLILTFDSGVD